MVVFLRKDCKSLNRKPERAKKEKLNRISKYGIRKNVFHLSSFLISFNRYCWMFNTYNEAIELMEKYATKIKNSDEFDPSTHQYADDLLIFLKSFKKGAVKLEETQALWDEEHWERFALGTLNQIHKEYWFDMNSMSLI